MTRLIASSGLLAALFALTLAGVAHSDAGPSTTTQSDSRQYLLKFLVMENKEAVARPYLLVQANQLAKAFVTGKHVLLLGTPPEQIETGLTVEAKVSPAEEGAVRLDLTLATTDRQPADSGKIRIAGHSVREVQIVKLGQRIHLALDNDSRSVYLTIVSEPAAK